MWIYTQSNITSNIRTVQSKNENEKLLNYNTCVHAFRIFNGRVLNGCCLSVFLSALALIAFQITSTWGIAFNITFMLIAGICNCGPDPLLTGSVPAKIGEKVNAQAAVSGVVNGKLLIRFRLLIYFMLSPLHLLIVSILRCMTAWP